MFVQHQATQHGSTGSSKRCSCLPSATALSLTCAATTALPLTSHATTALPLTCLAATALLLTSPAITALPFKFPANTALPLITLAGHVQRTGFKYCWRHPLRWPRPHDQLHFERPCVSVLQVGATGTLTLESGQLAAFGEQPRASKHALSAITRENVTALRVCVPG